MNDEDKTRLRRRIDHVLSQHVWVDKDHDYCACRMELSDMDAHRAWAVANLVSELLDAKDAEISTLQSRIDAVQKIHYPENDKWGGIQCFVCRVSYPCDTVKAVRGEPNDSTNLSPDADESTLLHRALADIGAETAKLHEEILLLNDKYNRMAAAWRSARERARVARSAWRYQNWRINALGEEMRKQDEFARYLWDLVTERRQERDRYRAAWLSAQERASRRRGELAVSRAQAGRLRIILRNTKRARDNAIKNGQMWKRAFKGQEQSHLNGMQDLLSVLCDSHRILNLHYGVNTGFGSVICAECKDPHPCPTALIVRELHRRVHNRDAVNLSAILLPENTDLAYGSADKEEEPK